MAMRSPDEPPDMAAGGTTEPPGPEDLAREVGVSGVRLRGFLRGRYPDEAPGKGGRWSLRADQVAEVRAYFTGTRTAPAPAPTAGSYHDAWFWEGNVQTAIARCLEEDGWTIVTMADTALRARGDDIVATQVRRTLRVEVKGWPSKGRYADERRADEVKRTEPSLQAGHWYSDALLKVVRRLHAHPEDEVAIGLPDTSRFRSLVAATETPLRRLGIGVYLVREGPLVECVLPHERARDQPSGLVREERP